MKQEDFFEILGKLDETYVAEAEEPVKKKGRVVRKYVFILGAAACISLFILSGRRIELSGHSKGVRASYAFFVPRIGADACLVYLTEEELFTEWSDIIVKGTVKKIDNIKLDFNGSTMYRALADIQVEKVYHGKCAEGKTIRVLLPGAVTAGSYNSIMDTLGQLKVGMTGIFMPKEYTADSLYQTNGATLCLRDLAEYGFGDGIRFAFLETKDGLVFDEGAYVGAQGAYDLEDIEAYIYEMLELYLKEEKTE